MHEERSHKERVQAQFGASAEAYVQSVSHAGGKDLARMVELSGVTATSRVLDVATGGGHTALAFAPHAGEVVATDLTERMLEKAQAFIQAKGHQNVRFAQADAEALPFADASFEIVTCRIAPHHFSDPAKAVAEFARVLVPGGRLLIVDSLAPADPALDLFINRVEWMRDPTHVRSYTEAEWRAFCQAAGLAVQHTEVHTKFHEYADWVARARMAPEAAAELAAAFRAAPEAVRAYFQVVLDGERVVSFVDEKLLLVATKR
jgi:ubiquinone/menaquinone biosynthesis C-methylase UbiE